MGSKRGRGGPSAPSASAPPALPGQLHFQFWDDRKFTSYGVAEQKFLADRLSEVPIPKSVQLPSGRYEVQNFHEIALGRAVQVNGHTKFERTLRLKPPYQLPDCVPAQLPPELAGGMKFQYSDNGWRDLGPTVQHDLRLVAQSTPLPQQTFFVADGGAYWLLGLDRLASDQQLSQVNAKTGKVREVRCLPEIVATTAPAPRPMPSPPSTGGGYPAASASSAIASAASKIGMRIPSWRPILSNVPPHAAGTPGASSSSSPAYASCPSSAWTRSAEFRICMRPHRGGMGGLYEPLHSDAQDILWKAWRQNPRPDQVHLPSGDVIENFLKLEEDRAGCWNKASGSRTWLPVELHAPCPAAGRVQLPHELELHTAFNMTDYGSYLNDQEVAALPPTNGAESECPICRCDLKPDEGDNASPNPNPVCGNTENPVQTNKAGVFELRCGHVYHGHCLEQWFETRRRCPECQKEFGKVTGDQPRVGLLEWHTEQFPLPGHRGKQTIVIEFSFPPGTSDSGVFHEGRRPKGYLPGNVQGIILLELFKVAFRRRVMFGLGHSMTLGTYRPTFNIHIKTSTHRGSAGHGYPDEDYFHRSLEELRTNGVTVADSLD